MVAFTVKRACYVRDAGLRIFYYLWAFSSAELYTSGLEHARLA